MRSVQLTTIVTLVKILGLLYVEQSKYAPVYCPKKIDKYRKERNNCSQIARIIRDQLYSETKALGGMRHESTEYTRVARYLNELALDGPLKEIVAQVDILQQLGEKSND